MADLIGMLALSHSPFWNPRSTSSGGPGDRFFPIVQRARSVVAELDPDAVIIIGPDHFRNFFYDLMPPFCVGAERITAFGDYSTPAGELPCASRLGHFVFQAVTESGFDPALSLHIGIDHGIGQTYAALVPDLQLPMVPIMMNASAPPLPTMDRCYRFGQAVGAAVRSAPFDDRVVVVASGGLSHWLPSNAADDPALASEWRSYLIDGRKRAHEVGLEREELFRAMGEATGPVNEEWDRWFLARLRDHDLEELAALDADEIERLAGNGANEVRSWLAAAAAWDGPLVELGYEPMPEWITGMGCVSSHAPSTETKPEEPATTTALIERNQ